MLRLRCTSFRKHKIAAFAVRQRKPEGAACESKTSDMDGNGETDNNIFVLKGSRSVIEEGNLLLEHCHPLLAVFTQCLV